MVDRLVPLARFFIEPGGAPVQVAEPFAPHLGGQTAEQELTDRFGVAHNALLTRDENAVRFKGGKPGSGIVVIEQVAHDERVKGCQDSGTREQLLLGLRLGVEEGLDLEVEGRLDF